VSNNIRYKSNVGSAYFKQSSSGNPVQLSPLRCPPRQTEFVDLAVSVIPIEHEVCGLRTFFTYPKGIDILIRSDAARNVCDPQTVYSNSAVSVNTNYKEINILRVINIFVVFKMNACMYVIWM